MVKWRLLAFAINDSSVLKMIRAKGGEAVLKKDSALPGEGIVIGEAKTAEDIRAWAGRLDGNWLLAGGGDFFKALLNLRFKESVQPVPVMECPHLFVSGTAFQESVSFIREVKEQQDCVSYMPVKMIETGNVNDQEWLQKLGERLVAYNKCVVAIGEEAIDVSALHLRTIMAKVIKKVMENNKIHEMLIEGGSTAAAILSELGITDLTPVNEWQRGVVRMKAKDIYITVKPGSYELPEAIRDLYPGKI